MSTQEDEYDICGVTGGDIEDCCGQKVLAEDTMMIDNTSVCIGCYEKWCKVEKEKESFTDEYCEWLRLKDIDCGDDKTLREYKILTTMNSITYETVTSQYDNDKVMLFKYNGKEYDYSDELYWDKDNYKYEWINLVIKEYNLEFGDRWCFDHKHNADNGFMFWRKHGKRPIIHSDFKICSNGHLWKARRYVKDVKGKLKVSFVMVKVKSNLFEEEFCWEVNCDKCGKICDKKECPFDTGYDENEKFICDDCHKEDEEYECEQCSVEVKTEKDLTITYGCMDMKFCEDCYKTSKEDLN